MATSPPQNSGAKWPVVIGFAAEPSMKRKAASTSSSKIIENRSAFFTFPHPSPAVAPVTNMRSDTAAMPVEAPEARNNAPINRASLQKGMAELLMSTPV